jgi:hypothetical protein
MMERVAVSRYPMVPAFPGVPTLRRPAARDLSSDLIAVAGGVALLTRDNLLGYGVQITQQWGVFQQNGVPLAIWDNVVSVDYRHETRISTFPVEQGGFQSYNKVQMPYDARVRFTIGPSGLAARVSFLRDLEQAVLSLNYYLVVTPEAVYPNANLTHIDYRREARNGISLLVVDVWLEEVRATAVATNTTSPTPTNPDGSGSSSVNQPQSPTASQTQSNGAVQPVDASVPPPPAPSPTGTSDMPTRGVGSPPPVAPASVPPAMPSDGSLIG